MIDLTGKRFGKWTVIARDENWKKKYTQWLCRCDCGTERLVLGNNLRRGISRSCHTGECAAISHGRSKSKAYCAYHNMIQRCTNKSHKSYGNYGGRGIVVCSRWLQSFENFLDDMGEPDAGLSLERIDNEHGYSPENCKWESAVNQRRNTRSTKLNIIAIRVIRYMYAKGRTITEIANAHNLNFYTVRDVVIGKTWKEV